MGSMQQQKTIQTVMQDFQVRQSAPAQTTMCRAPDMCTHYTQAQTNVAKRVKNPVNEASNMFAADQV